MHKPPSTGSVSSASPADLAALRLVHYPHPVLRRRAAEVTVFDDRLAALCARMFELMDEERGIGLAAPQVGVSLRIFVTDHAKREQGAPPSRRIWINPVIENPQGETVYEEGCLSFPGIYAKVRRFDRFTIRWQDLDGEEHRESLDVSAGQFLGIVVQHELDHLDGILFVDHLNPLQLRLVRRKLRELEDAYRRATGTAGCPIRR
ncbi:MAG: peptide deformylase [Planctomycetota bacterium]|nr:peptide deformylase [Planctomycetota bacterium]MDW8373463.1 peptide deformylase [Planctomycetota bacterium]